MIRAGWTVLSGLILVGVAQAADPMISDINVQGNGRTDESVIRRIMDIEVGDALEEGTGDRQWRRLMDSGFFRDVHIAIEAGSRKNEPVFNVTVLESEDPWDLRQEYGYRLPYGAYARLQGSLRNPMGKGRRYTGNVLLESNRSTLGADMVEPWFRATQWDAGLGLIGELYNDQRLFPFRYLEPDSLDGEGSHRFVRTGGEIFGARRLDRLHDLRFTYHLDRVEVGRTAESDETLAGVPGFEEGTNWVAYIAMELTRDGRSTGNRGGVVTVHLRGAHTWLGSSSNHGRAGIDGAFYLPGVASSHTLKLGAGARLATSDIPYSERFRLGTDMDVTGFRPQEVGPEGVERFTYADGRYDMKIVSGLGLGVFASTARGTLGETTGEWESLVGADATLEIKDWVQLNIRGVRGLGELSDASDRVELSLRLTALDGLVFATGFQR